MIMIAVMMKKYDPSVDISSDESEFEFDIYEDVEKDFDRTNLVIWVKMKKKFD